MSADPPRARRPGDASSTVLDLGQLSGLTEAEASARLAAEGPNELPEEGGRGVFRIALEVAREPMFLMLVGAGTLYLLMGEPADAAMLLGFVVVVMGITIVQERRTERALDALRDLSSPRALVIRDGGQRRIPGREVVRGDLVVVSEGDRVPADGVLRQGQHVSVDESLLTGESVPVRKAPDPSVGTLDAPGGDDLPSLFSGTLVTAGQGIVDVLATGERSQLGRIGSALRDLQTEPTPLQRETGRMVRTFAAIGLSACAVVVVAYALTRGATLEAWKDGLLAGIAMAMATLPEEFPVVLTVFLSLGAWRISRRGVLTRRMPAIETLGSATVLCVDKTGTLTQNRMTLRVLRAATGDEIDLADTAGLPEAVHEVLELAILSSRRDPFDPMERALVEAGDQRLAGTEHLHPDWTLEREYPLTPGMLAVSQAWRTPNGIAVASKGAPEAIADLCHLTPEQTAALDAEVSALASRGLRVLAVARGRAEGGLPEAHHDLELDLVGLVGFEDPLRPSVPEAVADCRAAGVHIKMITGDYAATARSIARQAGLEGADNVLTGAELDQMTDAELEARIADVAVFARVVPAQKLRLVQALKARGEVVAMTGDGVNDAPALKAAHIGVAMGGRGTDVAREAASLVLLDDDFSSIVAAVRLGRRIYDNLRKAIAFIIAVHVPIIGLSMLPVFVADWPLLLLPVHVVFLELVIDPSCTLIFEAEEAEDDVMRRPPRRPGESLFSAAVVRTSVLQGLSVLAACVAVFLLSRGGHSPDVARALTFTTLVVASLAIITVNRSWTRSAIAMLAVRNGAFVWVVGGAISVLTLVLTVPAARARFHFETPHLDDLGLSLAAGLGCLIWFELLKVVWRHPSAASAASAALFVLTLGAAASQPFDFGFGAGLGPIPSEGAPPPGRCAPCHEDIHADWSASRHRVSWTNDLMIAGFVAEPLEFCVNCHAPFPEQRAEVLANRDFYRALDPRRRPPTGAFPRRQAEPTAAHGIHCATCHVRGDLVIAAERSPASPHDTRVEPSMREGDFCVHCHEFPMPVTHDGTTRLSDAPMQSTGTEWRAWRDGGGTETCQGCHMPDGRHRFRGAHDRDWLRSSVAVTLDRPADAGPSRFTLRSVGVGHHLPTGDLFRHLTLEVERAGVWTVVDWIGRRFEPDAESVRRVVSDTSLRPGEPRVVEVSPPFDRWRLVYHYGSAIDEARGLLDAETLLFELAAGEAR